MNCHRSQNVLLPPGGDKNDDKIDDDDDDDAWCVDRIYIIESNKSCCSCVFLVLSFQKEEFFFKKRDSLNLGF